MAQLIFCLIFAAVFGAISCQLTPELLRFSKITNCNSLIYNFGVHGFKNPPKPAPNGDGIMFEGTLHLYEDTPSPIKATSTLLRTTGKDIPVLQNNNLCNNLNMTSTSFPELDMFAALRSIIAAENPKGCPLRAGDYNMGQKFVIPRAKLEKLVERMDERATIRLSFGESCMQFEAFRKTGELEFSKKIKHCQGSDNNLDVSDVEIKDRGQGKGIHIVGKVKVINKIPSPIQRIVKLKRPTWYDMYIASAFDICQEHGNGHIGNSGEDIDILGGLTDKIESVLRNRQSNQSKKCPLNAGSVDLPPYYIIPGKQIDAIASFIDEEATLQLTYGKTCLEIGIKRKHSKQPQTKSASAPPPDNGSQQNGILKRLMHFISRVFG